MPSEHRAADCLADIVENAERIEQYLEGAGRDAFERDGRTRDAVERRVERVCEAVVRLADRADELMAGHHGGGIKGMGNRLRHAYGRLNTEVI